MTVRLAPACLQRSATRWTAAAAPEMTVWSGELRLAGETTALLGEKACACGLVMLGVGSGVRSSETWAQMSLMRSAERPRMAAMAPSPGGNGLLHVAAAAADGADGVGEGEGAGGDVGGVLAEGVAGGEGGGDALFGQDAGGGDGDGEDGGLGVLGELELVFGAFEDEFGEREAEGLIGLVEDGAGRGEVVVEVSAHADGLRALAGEEEGRFGHLNLW